MLAPARGRLGNKTRVRRYRLLPWAQAEVGLREEAARVFCVLSLVDPRLQRGPARACSATRASGARAEARRLAERAVMESAASVRRKSDTKWVRRRAA